MERYKKYIAALVEVLGSSIPVPSILTLHSCMWFTSLSNLKDKFDKSTKEERQKYYEKKFTHLNQDLLPKEVVESYVTGVQWVLQYYYTGMPSWDWWVHGAVTVM